MRKISNEIAQAFKRGEKLTKGNTYTDGKKVFLHSNLIAEKQHPDKLAITLAGWPTVTTRERLNAILNICGWDQYIQQSEGEQYIINGSNNSKHLMPVDSFVTFRRVGDNWQREVI